MFLFKERLHLAPTGTRLEKIEQRFFEPKSFIMFALNPRQTATAFEFTLDKITFVCFTLSTDSWAIFKTEPHCLV